MKISRRSMAVAVAALLMMSARSEAQVTVSATCSPGIPSCGSLRFFIEAVGGVTVDQLFIELISPSWQFVGGPLPTIGTYSAADSFGPFSGFTTIGNAGTSLAVDFLDNGFPMTVLPGDTGLLDLAATGGTDANNLFYQVIGTTDDGSQFTVSVTPEPATLTMLGTGLAAIAAARRRRKNRRAT